MAQTAAIVSALKNALKEQGITYQQVAEALDLSEASVKRLFSERQFSLQRLDQICSLLGLEISDLVRRLDQAQRIDALTTEQEQELVGDDRRRFAQVISAHGVIAIAAKLGSDIASASICADDSEEIAGAVSKLVQDLVRNKRI